MKIWSADNGGPYETSGTLGTQISVQIDIAGQFEIAESKPEFLAERFCTLSCEIYLVDIQALPKHTQSLLLISHIKYIF